MQPDLFVTILKIASGIAIALISSWSTVFLTRNKYKSERLWERKVIAYERVVEAFHKAKKFSSEHLDAVYANRELPDDRDKELRRLAHEARDEIDRATDIGSFWLSPKAQDILKAHTKKSTNMERMDSWHSFLEEDYALLNQTTKALVEEAKIDLNRQS